LGLFGFGVAFRLAVRLGAGSCATSGRDSECAHPGARDGAGNKAVAPIARTYVVGASFA